MRWVMRGTAIFLGVCWAAFYLYAYFLPLWGRMPFFAFDTTRLFFVVDGITLVTLSTMSLLYPGRREKSRFRATGIIVGDIVYAMIASLILCYPVPVILSSKLVVVLVACTILHVAWDVGYLQWMVRRPQNRKDS